MKHGNSRRLARFTVTASLCAFAALGTACHGRARTEPSTGAPTTPDPHSGPAIALVDVSGGLSEVNEGGFMGLGPKKHSFDEVLRVLDKVRKDKDDKGVLVRFGATSFGLARAQEFGEALEAVRKDKPVYCHADGYTNATMYAAARGCSKIYASPAGEVNAIGIAAQVVYMRRLLADELHFNIDFLQVGKFKGAEEPLTRDGPSPEARESLESVLGDMRASWLDGIKTGRTAHAGVVEAAEDGPYSVQRAKEKGLIDEVGYLDEAREHEKAATGAVREAVRFGGAQADDGEDLGDILSALGGQGSSSGPIALLRASGEITMGGGGGLLGGGGGITEKQLGRQISRLTKDDRVKAVVLRIDSPGGSALASDLLWHELMRLRAKKPIVVSVGDMAASGGYYLACSGNVIFADSASIVGSIGVVGGKIGVGEALEKIGVHAETFAAKKGDPKAAKRAANESLMNSWDDDTRERVLESMTAIYNLFLQRISEGRKLPVDKIALSAEGRIFSGRQGKERGLVDEIGGLTAAIAKARELAKLPADARVTVVEGKPKFLESLAGGDSDADERTPIDPAGEVSRLQWAPSRSVIELVQQLAPELVPFLASMAPLANHERSITAMPFALTIR
jgi:protease-4